jgi:hypothetical protein
MVQVEKLKGRINYLVWETERLGINPGVRIRPPAN